MTEPVFNLMKPCIQNMTSPPFLKQLSLNKIAILLWSKYNYEISQLFNEDRFESGMTNSRERWTWMTEEVEKNTSSLVIPRALRSDLKDVIKNIHGELCMFSWDVAHALRDRRRLWVQNLRLFWTPHGTIDKWKTINGLLDDVVGDECDADRMLLACWYLLEDQVTRLWMLPTISRTENFEIIGIYPDENTYWKLFMDGKLYNEEMKMAIESQFIDAILQDKEIAYEYYWSMMKDATRSKMIGSMIDMWNGELNLLKFMLTRIPEEQLAPWIQQKLSKVLQRIIFSNQQWSLFFLSSELFGNLSDENFSDIFMSICQHDIDHTIYFNKFLLLAWKTSSSEWKSKRLKYDEFLQLLLHMISCYHLDVLHVMLKDVIDEEKFEFLIRAVPNIFEAYCDNEEAAWENFLEECLQCEDSRTAFKKALSVHGMKNIKKLMLKDKYKKFFELIHVSQKDVQSNSQSILFHFVSLDYEGIDLDEFLTWCLLSADERKPLNEEVRRNDKRYLVDRKQCITYDTLEARYYNRYIQYKISRLCRYKVDEKSIWES